MHEPPHLVGGGVKIEDIDDYVSGQMKDVDAFEERLFEALPPELALYDDVIAATRYLAGRSAFFTGILEKNVDALLASGRRIAVIDADGTDPIPEWAEQVLYSIGLDLTGIEQVDIEILNPDGQVMKVMPDMEFEPGAKRLLLLCEAHLARIASNAQADIRFVGVSGQERRILRAESRRPA